jgi:hypothetical protein
VTYLKELIHIPEQVNRGDFVLNLAEGVRHPESTLRDYVVTDQLAAAFDDALTFMRSVFDSQAPKSKATYLHGSFGSGKSHFMAVLSLLLEGLEAARLAPRLQPVAAKHPWCRGKRFLLVPLHMIGRNSMEEGVLKGYADFITAKHPEAPLPAFFRSSGILANALELRKDMGDGAFFRKLNGGTQGAEGGSDGGDWGDYENRWDARSYEAAAGQPDPLHEEKQKLVSDIISRILPALRSQGEYVPLDEGLLAMSSHAKNLGYDAVVLFLDELVLWLMSRSADPQFISAQGPKIAHLVEGRIAAAPIPIISFIARQRDLREALGDSLTGSTQRALSQTMDWWEERFHKITLEDRNLPVIVQERLLKPVSAEAKSAVDEAFARTASVRQEVMQILLTAESSRDAFRNLYPFSPALVQALVAVSSQLQRDRTALRILLQMLSRQRETLELGTVVPVGDLWDYIRDESFSANLRAQAETAKRIWDQHFQPLLLHEVGLPDTTDPEALSRDPANRNAWQQFQMRARIVKTLLLAALVPGIPALARLTTRKLAALNHGTIRSPIPNQEGRTLLGWLRAWAARVENLKMSGESEDPVFSIELTDIDTFAILEEARGEDNQGNRRRLLKELLYAELGIEMSDSLWQHHRLEWRGVAREVEIRFLNVRTAGIEDLRAQADKWVLAIDYPFDEPGHNPTDDRANLAKIRERLPDGSRTIVWLPNFFSHPTSRNLGDQVVLNYLLTRDRLDGYTGHLNAREKQLARELLENRQKSLKGELVSALEVSYGVSLSPEGAIDRTLNHPADQFLTLQQGFAIQPPDASRLKSALERLLTQALEYQFPQAPVFLEPYNRAKLRRIAEYVEKAVAGGRERVDEVERPHREMLAAIAEPLGLGTVNQDVFALKRDWREHFQRQMAAENNREPSVAALRAWCDRPQPRGLPTEICDLLIWSYALAADCRFYEHGARVQVGFEALSPSMILRPQTLPDPAIWTRAIEKSQHLFGYTGPSHRNAATLAILGEAIQRFGKDHHAVVADMASALRDAFQLADLVQGASERYSTAVAAGDLLSKLRQGSPEEAIAALAQIPLPTSPEIMAKAIRDADAVKRTLQKIRWTSLKRLAPGEDAIALRASELLRRLTEALAHEQHAMDLVSLYDEVDRGLEELLVSAAKTRQAPAPVVPRPEPDTETDSRQDEARKAEAEADRLRQEREGLERELQEERRKRLDAERRAQAAAEPMILLSGSADAGQQLSRRLAELAKAHPGRKIRIVFEIVEEDST